MRDKKKASLRVVPRDLHFGLRPRISTAFCPKEATYETCFSPLIRGKLGKKGQDKGDIARISFSTPPLNGRRNVFRGHAESSGSVSSTFILLLESLSSARLFVTGDGASRVWLFDSLLLLKIGDEG